VEKVVRECRVLIADVLGLTEEKLTEVRAQVRIVLEGIERHRLEGEFTLSLSYVGCITDLA
jgi:hypothetical protein